MSIEPCKRFLADTIAARTLLSVGATWESSYAAQRDCAPGARAAFEAAARGEPGRA